LTIKKRQRDLLFAEEIWNLLFVLLLKYCYGHIFILNRLLTKTLQQKRNNKIDQVFYFQENLN
jgi:hypothetical protein